MSLFSRKKPSPVRVNAVDAAPGSRTATLNGGGPGRTDSDLERDIRAIGTEFLDLARSKKAGLLSAQFWSDKIMDLAMKDEQFKVQLFRFIDTFPALKTPEQVHEHLVDYLTQPGVTPPPGMDLGLKAGGMAKGLFTKTMTNRITNMAQKFIAGQDATSSVPVLSKLWKQGMCFSVDLLGEACISARVADSYQEKYLDLVEKLPSRVADFPANDHLESDHIGPIPRVNVSIKVTSLYWGCDPIDAPGTIDALMGRLGPILEAAGRHGVHINFDIEQAEFKDLTLDLFEACCDKYDFPAGLALQAYLRSGEDDARRLIDWAQASGRQITVRLVKGAYWDAETIDAERTGRPVPVWSRKPETDACFERMAAMFIDNMPREAGQGGVKLALGSHNARSISHTLACARRAGLPDSAVEMQMLHGMGDQLKHAAIKMGLRLREYVPVGEMLVGMAYFVRRLLENTSNESWLRAGFSDNVSNDQLLADPGAVVYVEPEDPGVAMIRSAPERHEPSDAVEGVADGRPFFNEPPRAFESNSTAESFTRAIAAATVPTIDAAADSSDGAESAIAAAHGAYPAWRDADPLQRSAVLIKVAHQMRQRRDELAGILIKSAGQTWREADNEVCRAIDYCEFYAREAVGLFQPHRRGRFIGELNETLHQPRGVALIVNAFYQPLAELCGAVAAALSTGNTAVVLPAPQVGGPAKLLYELFTQAGTPVAGLQMLYGADFDALTQLANDPRTALVVCADERVEAERCCLEPAPDADGAMPRRKPFLCRMPGRNTIIVDASADLGEAVTGVRMSAFGFAGQNPTGCRFAIVHETAYDAFIDRLCEATAHMTIGDPMQPGTSLGPVIDEDRRRVVEERIEASRNEGRMALAMELPTNGQLAPGRAYVAPHILVDLAPDAQCINRPILGPVLAVMKASSFDAALDMANASGGALTGGVYSRKPTHIDRTRAEFLVPGLYINRPITGSLVGRHPQAGAGWSDMSQAALGDVSFLKAFTSIRTVVENTMRRGFAPEL